MAIVMKRNLPIGGASKEYARNKLHIRCKFVARLAQAMVRVQWRYCVQLAPICKHLLLLIILLP